MITGIDYTATITEANGQERTLSFDNKGRLSSVTGANCGQCGNSDITSYGYDTKNQLTSKIDGLNQTTGFGYDAVGNQVSVKAPSLKETKQVYDALNRLSETTDAKLGKTNYSYDTANNLISVKAPDNVQTTYSYDGFGSLRIQTSPDTGTTSFTYDIAGNQLSKTDAKNIFVNYNYDALNRLSEIDYPNDLLYVSMNYDTGTKGKGRLSQISDGSASTT